MEKAYFKEKIDSMMPDLIQDITKESMRLFNSGAIDTNQYENDYLLPRIILTVAIENQIKQYFPLCIEGKKEVKNLRHF